LKEFIFEGIFFCFKRVFLVFSEFFIGEEVMVAGDPYIQIGK